MNAPTRNPVQPSPLKQARGTGSSKTGFHDWWLQRLTAVALVPLSIWFLFFLGGLAGSDYAAVRAAMAWPVNAALLVMLAGCLYWHGMLGLKVIVEDYVHTRWREVALQVLLRLGAWAGVVACVTAILVVWLGHPAGH